MNSGSKAGACCEDVKMTIDDETLMAFADGELPEPGFSEVATAVEADEALAALVDLFASKFGEDA